MSTYISYLKSQIQKNPKYKSELLFQNFLKELGICIAKMRKLKGYTQKQLAEKMAVPQSVIARVESGYNVKCSTLWCLSESLNIDLNIFGASTFAELAKLDKILKEEDCVGFLNCKEPFKDSMCKGVSWFSSVSNEDINCNIALTDSSSVSFYTSVSSAATK